MKQVVVIHGGNTFETYEAYLDDLRAKELTLDRLKGSDWKKTLQDELGSEYDVLTPRFPNSQNAKYLEWKIWFEKLIPLLNEDVIFIGHSLGGIFLAKYLSENQYPQKIRATLLLAAPFDSTPQESLADFVLPISLNKFAEQGGKIILMHSKDDVVVPFEQVARYQEKLPDAETNVFEDKGHFNAEEFPELITLLHTL